LPSGGLQSALHTLGNLRGDPDDVFNALQLLGAKKLSDEDIEDLVDQEAIQKLCMALNKFRDDPLMVQNISKVLQMNWIVD